MSTFQETFDFQKLMKQCLVDQTQLSQTREHNFNFISKGAEIFTSSFDYNLSIPITYLLHTIHKNWKFGEPFLTLVLKPDIR